jgi:putative selenate reductase
MPLGRLLRRAHYEFRRRQAIYDLPERKFYRPGAPGTSSATGSIGLDLSVPYAGQRAANPIGPAAGPQTQLAQNIALGWLAGARIFELKTVQVNDCLVLSRPCIDMATVGYNTEWSQELRLDESLREYVKASMLIEMLGQMGVIDRDSGLPPSPDGLPAGFGAASGVRDSGGYVFDISVGYDLEGIRSPAIVTWLESMRDARAIVDELRGDIPPEFAGARDHPFRTSLAAGITLSTFHGTPAEDIERIAGFLIGDLGFHTVIKLNPPMLGRERVEEILHGALGYGDVTVNPEVYDRNLPFEEAADVVRRLQTLAARSRVTVGVKCGNTLEVLNAGTFLKERVQYLSGQPLHALHAALAARWREAFGPGLQISFSAGVDAHNVADCVAAGLVPVTACTDLLRAGGYGRLSRYVTALEERMRGAGARTIPEFIERTAGGAADAMLLNTRTLLDRALTDARYRAARNRKPPRKLGTRLWLWDCVSCSKCIPVCPNDAVFEIEVEPFVGEVPVVEVDARGAREVGRRLYRAVKPTQIAIFADACNACGNCDVFCPEDGGPYLEKPRFFGRVESWRRAAPLTGFVLTKEAGAFVLRGRMAEGECTLSHEGGSDRAVFETGDVEVTLAWATHEVLSARRRGTPAPGLQTPVPIVIDLSPSMTLRLLLDALLRPPRVNFVNAEYVE